MFNRDYKKDLSDFCCFLDNMPSCKEKGIISDFFTSYAALYNDYLFLRHKERFNNFSDKNGG